MTCLTNGAPSRRPRWRRVAAVAALLIATAALRLDAQTAIIVHPEMPLTDVSVEELRRLFSGKTQTVGQTPVLVAEYTKLRGAFYQSLFGLGAAEVRRRWVALLFRGDASSLPQEFSTAAAIRKYVADHAGAIAFIEDAEVDATVKVLTVSGMKPSDAHYPFR